MTHIISACMMCNKNGSFFFQHFQLDFIFNLKLADEFAKKMVFESMQIGRCYLSIGLLLLDAFNFTLYPVPYGYITILFTFVCNNICIAYTRLHIFDTLINNVDISYMNMHYTHIDLYNFVMLIEEQWGLTCKSNFKQST